MRDPLARAAAAQLAEEAVCALHWHALLLQGARQLGAPAAARRAALWEKVQRLRGAAE